METIAAGHGPHSAQPTEPSSIRPKLSGKPNPASIVLFVGLLALGLAYAAWSLVNDVN